MLLPGCWWTKEPPSAGLKDGVVGGGLREWGGKGWIKNQSNWNGVWRRRTPCETVTHVPLLNMGQDFTVVIVFGSVPLFLTCHCLHMSILVYTLAGTYFFHFLSWQMWPKGSYFTLYTQLMWTAAGPGKSILSLCPHPQTPGFFSVTTPLCSVAPCSMALQSLPLPLCAFCPPSHAQQELLMPLQPFTPQQWGRHSLCSPTPSNRSRTTLVHWRWIQGAAFGVPTQQPSFTEGLIKPDNIPSALALLFSQLNAKWQVKASPRCRY